MIPDVTTFPDKIFQCGSKKGKRTAGGTNKQQWVVGWYSTSRGHYIWLNNPAQAEYHFRGWWWLLFCPWQSKCMDISSNSWHHDACIHAPFKQHALILQAKCPSPRIDEASSPCANFMDNTLWALIRAPEAECNKSINKFCELKYEGHGDVRQE